MTEPKPRPPREVCGVLRALAALLLLVTLTGGAPVALYVVAGSPLPTRLPSLAEMTGGLTRPDDGALVLSALKLIAWAAWVSFALAVVMDLAARVRGRPMVPHLPGFGTPQRLATGLITSALLAAGSPAIAAATPPPPVAVVAPPHPLAQPLVRNAAGAAGPPTPAVAKAAGTKPRRPSYQVKHGDTLSRIARLKLGSAKRWPRIWKLNAHRRQVDGRMFTNPNIIHPGWRLHLPRKRSVEPSKAPRQTSPRTTATPKPTSSPPPATIARSAAPAPRPATEHPSRETTAQAVITITLPSGTVVALSFAVGVSTALAATRLHRRRRRRSPPASAGVAVVPESPAEPVVEVLHRAHIKNEFLDHGRPPPSDADLVRSAFSIEVPDIVAIGVGADGASVDLSLPGLNLGLTGPCAQDVARAVVLGLLTQSDHCRAQITMASSEAEALFGPAAEFLKVGSDDLPGLRITGSSQQAVELLENERMTRARMLADHDAEDIHELLEADPGEVLPAMVLVIANSESADAHLTAILHEASRYGIGAILLGEWPSGTTCHVDANGYVSRVSGDLAPGLLHARLFRVASTDAPGMLRVIATGQGAREENPEETEDDQEPSRNLPTSPSREDTPRPVRLQILGVPIVQAAGREIPLSRRGKSLELLIYLALHPEGATREEICACLWPDFDPGDRFHSTLRHLRDPLRAATGLRKALFIRAEGDRYRIDTDTVSVDLWAFHQSLAATRTVDDNSARITALEQSVALIRGHLAHGAAYDWIDEERYPLTRASCDALAQLAELTVHDHPERALAALEQARTLDPDNEEIYRRLVQLQLRLERPDAVKRTARLLRARLDELGVDPEPETQSLLASLYERRRLPAPHVGPTSR